MEILVQIVDHGPNIDNIKAGEVITIQQDGWPWTDAELTHPNWRIIRAPILQSHKNSLLVEHTRHELRTQGVKYKRKAYLLDLSKLPNPAYFAGDRTQGIIDLQNSDILAATKKVA